VARKERDYSWPPAPEALPLPVTDNHTHLESLGDVARGGVAAPNIDEVIALSKSVGVARMVQVGCDLDSARATMSLIEAHAELAGAVAIHPNEAPLHARTADLGPDGLEPHYVARHEVSLDDAIAEIGRLAQHPGIVAIGETGLDWFRTGPQGRVTQIESFRAHIALARELGLALQIHDRDAHADVIDVLLRDGAPERTVFHCFSGDAEMARVANEHGWFMSFAGPVTFGANEGLRDALRTADQGLILVETDAPYLTPHPFRGRPNAPYLTPHTVRKIAEVKDVSLEEACTFIETNTQRVYGTW
jgi:TatD DNase family protein